MGAAQTDVVPDSHSGTLSLAFAATTPTCWHPAGNVSCPVGVSPALMSGIVRPLSHRPSLSPPPPPLSLSPSLPPSPRPRSSAPSSPGGASFSIPSSTPSASVAWSPSSSPARYGYIVLLYRTAVLYCCIEMLVVLVGGTISSKKKRHHMCGYGRRKDHGTDA